MWRINTANVSYSKHEKKKRKKPSNVLQIYGRKTSSYKAICMETFIYIALRLGYWVLQKTNKQTKKKRKNGDFAQFANLNLLLEVITMQLHLNLTC